MEIRPNRQRAKTAIVLIYIVLAFDILWLWSNYLQYDLLVSTIDDDYFDLDTINKNDIRQAVVAFFYLVAVVVSGVMFIRWFRRAYYNLETRTDNLKYRNIETTYTWFIPILSLFRPFQVMREMFRKTEIYLASTTKGYIPATTPSLGWWWTLWIVNNILGYISFRLGVSASDTVQLINSTLFDMSCSVVSISVALLAILVIQNYNEKERLMENINADTQNVESENNQRDDTQTELSPE